METRFAEHTVHEHDMRFMQRALELARATTGLASPNPYVGCVLTRDNEIIAQGAHLYDLYDHAEIVALKQAAERGMTAAGATAYVTLEPCSHHGRTGPCADALIAARIARCVVATQDPNPKVSGQGIAKLRAAGIEVTVGILREQAQKLNDAFAHFMRYRRPHVTLKAALSVDGKIAPALSQRAPNEPYWLTGPAAREDVQRLRHASDAVLTGVGTVLADDPALTDRSGLARRRPLLRVVLDSRLRTPLCSQIAQTANHDVLIITGEDAPISKVVALGHAGIDVERVPSYGGRLSLAAVLTLLGERDILNLLLETGSTLNGAFLEQDLVDQAILFYAEAELGSGAIPFAPDASPILLQQRLQRQSRVTFAHGDGEDVRILGVLHDAWPTQLT